MTINHAGYQPTSLVDYPGEVASVIFLPGCNLRCPYCHNPDLVYMNPDVLDPIDNILEDIEKRKKKITAVVISGGEATLYNDLDILIEKIKKMGLLVKLDTNGSFPERLENLNVDYFALDIKTSPDKYPSLGLSITFDKVLKSLKYIQSTGTDYEIRSTAAPMVFTKEDLILLLPYLKDVKNYYITNFRQGLILNNDFNRNSPYSQEDLIEFKNICLDAGVSCILR